MHISSKKKNNRSNVECVDIATTWIESLGREEAEGGTDLWNRPRHCRPCRRCQWPFAREDFAAVPEVSWTRRHSTIPNCRDPASWSACPAVWSPPDQLKRERKSKQARNHSSAFNPFRSNNLKALTCCSTKRHENQVVKFFVKNEAVQYLPNCQLNIGTFRNWKAIKVRLIRSLCVWHLVSADVFELTTRRRCVSSVVFHLGRIQR